MCIITTYRKRNFNQYAIKSLLQFSRNLLISHYTHIGYNYAEVDRNFSPALLGIYRGVSIIDVNTTIANFRLSASFVSSIIEVGLRPCIAIMDCVKASHDFFPDSSDYSFLLSYYIWGKWPHGLLTNNYSMLRSRRLRSNPRVYIPFLPACFLVVGAEPKSLSIIAAETKSLSIPTFFFVDSNIGLQLFRYWIPFNLKSNYSKVLLISLLRAILIRARDLRKHKFYKKLFKMCTPSLELWSHNFTETLAGTRLRTKQTFFITRYKRINRLKRLFYNARTKIAKLLCFFINRQLNEIRLTYEFLYKAPFPGFYLLPPKRLVYKRAARFRRSASLIWRRVLTLDEVTNLLTNRIFHYWQDLLRNHTFLNWRRRPQYFFRVGFDHREKKKIYTIACGGWAYRYKREFLWYESGKHEGNSPEAIAKEIAKAKLSKKLKTKFGIKFDIYKSPLLSSRKRRKFNKKKPSYQVVKKNKKNLPWKTRGR